MKNIRLHILYILTKYIGYWHFSYILEKIKHILTKIYHLVICKINVSKYIFECISVYSTIVLLKCTLIIFCNIFFKQKETLRVTICLFIVLSNGSLLFFCSTLTDSFRHLNFFKLCKLFLNVFQWLSPSVLYLFLQVGMFVCEGPLVNLEVNPKTPTELVCGDVQGKLYFLSWKEWALRY